MVILGSRTFYEPEPGILNNNDCLKFVCNESHLGRNLLHSTVLNGTYVKLKNQVIHSSGPVIHMYVLALKMHILYKLATLAASLQRFLPRSY